MTSYPQGMTNLSDTGLAAIAMLRASIDHELAANRDLFSGDGSSFMSLSIDPQRLANDPQGVVAEIQREVDVVLCALGGAFGGAFCAVVQAWQAADPNADPEDVLQQFALWWTQNHT